MLDRGLLFDIDPLDELEKSFDQHHRIAYGLAYGMLRNRQEAEETLQDAFLSVWRARNSFDETRGSTRTWILAAVRNRALDVLRARKRRPESETVDRDRTDTLCDVEATAVKNVDRESVLRVLATVPPPQRDVLELAYWGGLSHTEIAERLNLPVGTVKSRIRLALDHLRLVILDETFAQVGHLG